MIKPLSLLFVLLTLCGSACAALVNGNFEQDADHDNVADSWSRINAPLFDWSGTKAASGSGAVEVNLRNSVLQRSGIAPGMQYTMAASLHSDVAFGYASFLLQWEDQHGIVGADQSPWLGISDEYQRRYFSASAPLDATQVAVAPRSPMDQFWAWVDDVALYGEDFANGDFEQNTKGSPANWSLNGAAVYDRSGSHSHSGKAAIALGVADEAVQRIAAVDPAKQYAARFWVRSDAPSSGTLDLHWMDEFGDGVSHQQFLFNASPQWQMLAFFFSPPTNAQLLRFALKGNTIETVWIDDASISWITASPRRFSPNADDLQDKTTIYFYLPQAMEVSARITEPGGKERLLLDNLFMLPGVQAVQWDGRWDDGTIAADGTVEARVAIGDLVLHANIIVAAARTYRIQPTLSSQEFPIGIWGLGAWNESLPNKDELLDQLKAAGFNCAIPMSLPVENRAELMAAASERQFGIYLWLQEIDQAIRRHRAYAAIDEWSIRKMADAIAQQFANSPALRGYYLTDEPGIRHAQAMGIAERIFARVDPLHPGMGALADTPDLQKIDAFTQTPVMLFDSYPFFEHTSANAAAMRQFVQTHRAAREAADAAGKKFWAFIQSFSLTDQWRRPMAEEIRAQFHALLALDARGIFYFMQNSGDELAGLYDKQQKSTPLMKQVARLNDQMEQVISTLESLKRSDQPIEVLQGDVLAQAFVNNSGVTYVYAANLDPQQPTAARLRLPGIMAIHAIDERDGITYAVDREGSYSVLLLTLAPGDGLLLRLEP